ncbi:AraC family transcriptional regulator [Agrobacterium vitis]|uniref:Helix-turn-helix domain-containing protein n=1 Tax=Agrobacterium vitis TaxID=373 RepID=A0AAE5AZ32_AGRVI|nr:AraC family transcriptional regulator [Allorhizobium sp. Av2]MCM2443298.1 AraC family transcriptional regulator [Agrobacterium vitis]MUZ60940.1 helix-turn-helix domain-containing protein [Agrobacterium vitis]MVA69202.1 helix-turn-helix domain-containing protein [Agrobacterium vitis]MVA90216.1 helix-turn-helix domain-containing protein [Agrobacterium vitis]
MPVLNSGANTVPTRFRFELLTHDDNDRLQSDSFCPVGFTSLGREPVRLNFGGTKIRDFCVWKTESATGFEARPRVVSDLVTIRFPISGGLARKDGREEVNIDRGQGVIIPFRDMEYERTSRSASMISCTIASVSIFQKMQALYGEERSTFACFVPVVDVNIPQIRIFRTALIRLHDNLQQYGDHNPLSFPIVEELLVFHLLSCWPTTAAVRPTADQVNNRVLRNALDYIEANLASPITVSEIAFAAGVSVRSLQIAFRESKGITPVQYIIECRLDRVHDALKRGFAPGYISQIANAWGFQHHADFSRRYRKRFGETPKQTRTR